MGAPPPKVEPFPPKVIESVVEVLLPPACRESVLGDLHERYASPRQYARDAALALPLVIWSRVRRTTDAGLLLLEAFALYLSFVAIARLANGAAFLQQPNAYLRLALPVVAALLSLVLADAYGPADERFFKRPAAAFAAMWLAFAFAAPKPDWALPARVMLHASYAGALMVFALRALFASGDNRTTGAS